MVSYCSQSDVGVRLGLNNAQRTQASSKLDLAIRRASIEVDQEFRDYGRDAPSREVAETTLDGAISAGATTLVLTSGTAFSSAGEGNIDGDSFKWTGKSTHTLSGVTGVSADHADNVTVQEGEMAHVLREICADLAAAFYMEDEGGTILSEKGGAVLRERGTLNLKRLAHLGTVN
tara:strand:+ start:736 stop:1260 length:525 start_codon:yes stop_codon:yes gene_type:complete